MIILLMQALGLSLAVQGFFFVFALRFKTDRFTDLAYGLTFILLTAFILVNKPSPAALQKLVAAFVVIWAVRLGSYLFVRILKIKRDRRFDKIRRRPLKFGRFWLLQGISVWLIMWPVIFFLSKTIPDSFHPLSFLGSLVWLIGLVTESTADWQKFQFKNRPENKDRWVDVGLWRFSRHPNYFGEMLIWWGLFITLVPFLSGREWLGILGPVYITFLLLFVSGVPLLEKKHERRYGQNPDYQKYKRRTGLIVPFFPPRRSKLAKQ